MEFLGAECVIEKLINAGIVESASLNELENIPQRVKDNSFCGDGEERTISLPWQKAKDQFLSPAERKETTLHHRLRKYYSLMYRKRPS